MSTTINEILDVAFEAAKEVRISEKKGAKGENWATCSEEHLRAILFDGFVEFSTSTCSQELLDIIAAAAALFIRMTGQKATDYSVAVRVSNTLKSEIQDLIADKRLGFASVIEFVNEALRNRVDYFRDAQLLRNQRIRY
ncbi:MAG: hypothetical protein ACXAB4_13810 [Candidatus Hodarchaeales archaeon]